MGQIQAILWDVAGPITNEEAMIPKWEVALIESASEVTGTPISRETFDRINRAAVRSFAPFVFRTIMFRLVGEVDELFEEGFRKFKDRLPQHTTELQPGIQKLLAELHGHIPMAIVANQAQGIEARLEEMGIAKYFDHVFSAGDFGMTKPDTRIFLHALGQLRVAPENALMIGDRIDNDIVPAKLLDIRTLQIRTGWHKDQRPRSPDERPDIAVDSITEMITEIRRLCL